MSKVYIDTSVLGAYYCPEHDSDKAERILLEIDMPIISVLSEVEFSSLIAKKRRMKELSEAKANKAQLQFQSHLEQGYYSKIAINNKHYLEARDLVANYSLGLRTLDALHLSLVLADGIPLFTGDTIFSKAAKKLGVEVIAL